MVMHARRIQSVHDAALAAREAAWREDGRYVQSWTNPGSQKNAGYSFGGVEQYPDLIVELRDEGRYQYVIEEIETESSVSLSDLSQWRNYAALPQPAWFTLVVPTTKVAEARALARGLNLFVAGYSRTASGVYTFSAAVSP